MKDLHEITRRLLLTQLCAAAATTALIGSSLKAAAQSPATLEDAPNTHNMLVFGEEKIYLSHLPMFHSVTPDNTNYTSPHRYQVILEASFHRGEQNLQSVYSDDRRKNASVRIYTLQPEVFVLPRLSSGSPQSPLLTGFKATVFRGHLEKGGQDVRGLDDVDVKISRVVHFRMFNPQVSKSAELKYLLFGSSQESFLAHYISQPPDFDQILSVKVDGHSFTDAELGKGVEVTILDKSNHAIERVKETQQVTGLTQTADARTLKFNLKGDKEIYFEEGELLVPPTFEDTTLEKTTN
jgi:hypothetical protein